MALAGVEGDDTTTLLIREWVDGKPLSAEEIACILRNWTVGEVGTLSATIGIMVHAIALDPQL